MTLTLSFFVLANLLPINLKDYTFNVNISKDCYAAKGDFRPLYIEYINGVRYNIRGHSKT